MQLTTNLSSDPVVIKFTSLAALQQEAEVLLHKLHEDGETGNQYLVVKRMPKGAQILLGEDRKIMNSVTYRFSWEGSTGQIKVVPSTAHTGTTRRLADKITNALLARGVSFLEFGWASTTAYRSLTGRGGKQPDDCFLPPTRQALPAGVVQWPTLVIVSGISESQEKMSEDANWWFENSHGRVRMVITLLINKKTIKWEMRQLTNPGQSPPEKNYFTRPPLKMPSLVLQHPANQRQYISQKGEFSQDRVIKNKRMYIHFQALYDRKPGRGEKDGIQLNALDFIDIARYL